MSRSFSFLTIFISSACVMVIELVAGRLIAPVLGVSLYSWTTVIGVILGGIGLGNYLGGRLADRYPTRRTLVVLLLLGALVSLSIVLNIKVVGYFYFMPTDWPIVLRFILSIGMVFFAPTCLLGMITPVVIKLSLHDLNRAGNTVGTLYAISLLGSIVGTFATGFYLIALVGTRVLIVVVAAVLALLGLLVAGRSLGRREGALAVVFVSMLGLSALANQWASPCARESNYFCIMYPTVNEDHGPVKLLFLDRLLHSYWSLTDPLDLLYDYEKSYAVVTEYQTRRTPTFDAFFIGGGGYVFSNYVTQVYPKSHVVAAEIDPVVTEVARAEFGLQKNPPIEIHDEDARLFLTTLSRERKFDLIYGDAFNDFSVPYHLTTREFAQLMKSHMRPGGIYVANVIDNLKYGHFLRAFVRTLQAVFADVMVLGNDLSPNGTGRQTLVVIASDSKIDRAELAQIAASKAEWADAVRSPIAQLDRFLAEESPLILSDDYVPTDNLLAPVFGGY